MFSNKLSAAIRACLSSHTPFAVVLPPLDDSDPLFLCDNGDADSEPRSQIRFFATDFAMPFTSATVIRDILTVDQAAQLLPADTSYNNLKPLTTDRNSYLESVSAVIARLRSEGGKTVIARTIGAEAQVDIVSAAAGYFDDNPAAFRCLYYTPKSGCWLIASPELLLSADKQTMRYETFSLAGTRRHIEGEEDAPWDDKNIDEQEIVTRYINYTLDRGDCPPDSIRSFTKVANRVEHLCTIFGGKLDSMSQYERLLDMLSPTPALAGFPRETAIAEICRVEQTPRALYGGYVALETPEAIQAWVAIRCCRFDNGGYTIFTGSGITPHSSAEDEWEETKLKASALLAIIERSTP